MAKLIGTGKDPRFPKGQDYDVPDFEVQHHVDAGLGEPVEPGYEASAVHRGRDTIAADQLAESEPYGNPAEVGAGRPYASLGMGEQRVAARVETTAVGAEGDAAVEEARSRGVQAGGEAPDSGLAPGVRTGEEVQGPGEDAVGGLHPESAESDDETGGLSQLTRDELNDRARAAGVEDAESLPNKEAVVEAIREAEASPER